MVTPNQMLFLRGSIGPIPAIYERRSTLSHSYKITTSFTSYVHEQIFIVRPLSPGGVIAYVPEFCRVVVDKSCRFLPLFGVSWVKVLLNTPPFVFVQVGFSVHCLGSLLRRSIAFTALLLVFMRVLNSCTSIGYIPTCHQGL